MKSLWERIKREPVLLSVLVSDAFALAIQFGLNISDARLQAITTVLSSLTLLMGGASVGRSQVVPLKSVISYETVNGVITAGPKSTEVGNET